MKKIMIDTNAYTTLLTGNEDVLDAIGEAETGYMSIFVLGELYAGFAGETKKRSNKNFFSLDRSELLNYTINNGCLNKFKSKVHLAEGCFN